MFDSFTILSRKERSLCSTTLFPGGSSSRATKRMRREESRKEGREEWRERKKFIPLEISSLPPDAAKETLLSCNHKAKQYYIPPVAINIPYLHEEKEREKNKKIEGKKERKKE